MLRCPHESQQLRNDLIVRFMETTSRRGMLQCARETNAHSVEIATMVELAKKTLKSVSSERLDVQIMEANGEKGIYVLAGLVLAPTACVYNCHDLAVITADTVDRVVSNQLAPDPDAMLHDSRRVLNADDVADFTIWAR